MNLNELIGGNIRSARWQKQMSQEELADKLGVSYQQIQKYERGDNRVAASTLVNISYALDVSIGYFVNQDHRESGSWDKNICELVASYKKLTINKQKALLAFMKED